MTKWTPFVAAAMACVVLGACQKEDTPAANVAVSVDEVEATKVFDATVAAWGSMDAAKIKALYAPDVVGFDYSHAPLVTDRATWDKNQDGFAAAKLDTITVAEKNIQLLGPNTFVVSSTAEGKSTTMPKSNSSFRCTDVYQRQPDGNWLIVNENCGPQPKAS